MTEESKVPVAPKAAVEAPILDNPREAIESAVIAKNAEVPETAEEVKEEIPIETVADISEVDRIKQSVQKRIDKVVAKQKSAEDELIEAKAEIARLKSNSTIENKNDDSPTIDQVEAYIVKMAEEGNKKEEIAATRYLIRLEKEAGIKEFEDRQKKQQTDSQAKVERENKALVELAKDYIVYDDKGQPDMSSDMTLANQKGKLLKTALALFNDPELNSQYYNDPDRSLGFRRAVQDASRELHAQGLVRTPKADGFETRRVTRQVLADPDAVEVDDTPVTSSNLLSDAEKVREEIRNRNKMRNSRRVS